MKEVDQLLHTAGESYEYTRQYVKNELELARLRAIELVSVTVSAIAFRTGVYLAVLVIIGFMSITAAFYIGGLYNSYAIGFGAISILYLLLLLMLFIFRKAIKNTFASAVIKAIKESDENEEK